MKIYNFPVVVERDADGYFIFCPEIQGCYSQGDTYEDAIRNIKDAIKLHLEDIKAAGVRRGLFSRSDSVSLSMVEVAA